MRPAGNQAGMVTAKHILGELDMNRLGTVFGSALLLASLLCLGGISAAGEGSITFDLNNYKQMADASSSATIPV